MLGPDTPLGWYNRTLFAYANLLYLLFACLCYFPARLRQPQLDWQLTVQVTADVIFIVTLMHASGGIVSGMGLLLLAVLAVFLLL